MIETVASLIIMGIVTAFVAFSGYVIITGENEAARKRKKEANAR